MRSFRKAVHLICLSVMVLCAGSVMAGKDAMPTVDEALAAKTDVWGELALREPNGPNYEFFQRLLPPLRYVNAAFRHYPIVLGAPDSQQKARLVSNGSSVNAKAVLKTWKEIGVPVTFRVGDGKEMFGQDLKRLDGPHLARGYLPVVNLNYTNDGAVVSEECFASVEPGLAESGVVFARFKGAKISVTVEAKVKLAKQHGVLGGTNGQGWVWFDWNWTWDESSQTLSATGRKPACLAIACKAMKPDLLAVSNRRFEQERSQCVAAWETILNRGMKVEVPEPVVNDAWKTTLLNNFALVKGNHANYSAGNIYECMYEAESGDGVLAFLLWGFAPDTAKMFGPLLDYTHEGLEFHNAAYKLQALATYFWMTRNTHLLAARREEWLRDANLLMNAREAKLGLLPRERYCGDIGTKVYSLNSNAAAWRGLRDMAAVLKEMGDTELAEKIGDAARTYRGRILAAVTASERKETRPPFIPIALFGEEKPYETLNASMMGGYWDLMAPYVLGSGLFANTEREGWIIDYLRQHGGICMGMIRFDQHSGLYANSDGLDDLYGLRYMTTLLRRDEVDPALVMFYGKLAQGLTRETFLGGEGTGLRPEDEFGRPMYLPPDLSAQAFFLWTLRDLLVQDWDLNDDGKPETLRLLFATPRAWLGDGKVIKVEHAPTAFGEISMRIRSRLNHREVIAEIDGPKRRQPERTLLRIRLPDGWRAVSAKSGGQTFIPDKDGTVDISKLRGKVLVRFKVER
jgi:hypothetical protein